MTGPAERQRHREPHQGVAGPNRVSLLQSKIGRRDEPDQHVCGMAAAFRPSRWHSTPLRGGDGAGSVLRLGTAPGGADGAGPGRRLVWTEPVLEKATTSLRARAQLEPPDFTQITDGSDGFELVVPVTMTDRSGTEVVHADITTWVTPVG
jgi:Domain of unknown function (DUF4442)